MQKRTFLRSVALSALALAASLGAAGSAEAYSGAWGSQTAAPTIRQTNYYYYSSYFGVGSGVPATAKVTTMYYSAGTTYIPSGLYVGVCPSDAGGGCYWTSSVSGSISPSDNRSANQQFRFGFYVSQATTHMLNPYVYPSGSSTLTVNYNY